MNTFWLKIAALAVVVVTVLVLIGVFTSSERSHPAEPQARPKTFYDQVEKDREKFLVEPRSLEEIAEEPAQEPAEQPVKQQVQEQNQPPVIQTPPQPVQPTVAKPPAQPTQLYFRPLSEIDKIEAERLLNVAVPGRSIGRLPIATDYQLMVEPCRQIISKWPDSRYAYRAKQLLADMPERFRGRYRITPQELDVSEFTKQRPGTEPFKGTDTAEEESF
jgi:hypothetical protein